GGQEGMRTLVGEGADQLVTLLELLDGDHGEAGLRGEREATATFGWSRAAGSRTIGAVVQADTGTDEEYGSGRLNANPHHRFRCPFPLPCTRGHRDRFPTGRRDQEESRDVAREGRLAGGDAPVAAPL